MKKTEPEGVLDSVTRALPCQASEPGALEDGELLKGLTLKDKDIGTPLAKGKNNSSQQWSYNMTVIGNY